MVDEGIVEVRRPPARWRDRLRKYVIEIDGAPAGQVARDDVLRVLVPAGSHRVRAAIDWTGSEEVAIDVRAGSTVSLVVKPTGNAFMFWQMVGDTGYLTLNPA